MRIQANLTIETSCHLLQHNWRHQQDFESFVSGRCGNGIGGGGSQVVSEVFDGGTARCISDQLHSTVEQQ